MTVDRKKLGRRNRAKGNEYENKCRNHYPYMFAASVPGKKRDDLRVLMDGLELSVETKNVGTPLSQHKMLEYAEERAPEGMPVVGITKVQGNGNMDEHTVVMRGGTLRTLLQLAGSKPPQPLVTERSKHGHTFAVVGTILIMDNEDGTISIFPDVGEGNLILEHHTQGVTLSTKPYSVGRE